MGDEMWATYGPEAQQIHTHVDIGNNTYTTFTTNWDNYATTRVRIHINVEDVSGNEKGILCDGRIKARVNKNGKIVLLGEDNSEVEIADVEELEHIVPRLIQIYDKLPSSTPVEKLVKEQMEKILERSGIL